MKRNIANNLPSAQYKEKSLAKQYLRQINQILDYKISKISTIESAIVQSVNQYGTVNISIPPHNTVFTNIQNQSIYRNLKIGDHVKVLKQNNNASNMWIIGGHKSLEIIDTKIDTKFESIAEYPIKCYTVITSESIGSTTWRVKIYSSGYAELVGKKSFQEFSSLSESGAIYYGRVGSYTFPIEFKEIIHMSFGFICQEGNAWHWGAQCTNQQVGQSYVGRGTQVEEGSSYTPIKGYGTIRVEGYMK